MASTKSYRLADKIIIGFTGSIGSGCTFVSEGIAKQFGNYKYYSLSAILKKAVKSPQTLQDVEKLQDLGNSLRKRYGRSYLVKKLLDENKKEMEKADVVIIDSIRNDGEVATLKQFPSFYLFSVHADESVRYKRTSRDKKFKDRKEFDEADERDKEEELSYGQQVKKCNDLADIIINNNNNIPKRAEKRKREFINHIHDKYISLIKNKKEGVLTPDNLPSVNETFMTMAYAESERSSCLKRKVGAIIAVDNLPKPAGSSYPAPEYAHVIASGHNEVPFGTTPCVFSEHEKCYRDHLQEEQAKKLKHCPNCGEAVKLSEIKCINCGFTSAEYLRACPECKYEFDVKYKCPNPECKTEIFEDYLLPAGKLLDMCKSLHAEENALLNLSKIGGIKDQNLVLYTTTYPCNLCANKIVMAGIKKVVYADPYPMAEAKKILESGKVDIEQFEGVKSSAFFRLYR